MKNIRVLPTDKPSRIYLIKSNNKLGITSNNPEFTENFGSGTQNQYIYITSDEKIKEGDWMIRGNEQPTLVTPNFFWDFGVRYYKIILTTDQDLIKEGVQKIDDTFLEWFVKNPSCESVEVSYEVLKPFQSEEKGYLIHCPDNEVLQEPKQETLNHIVYNIGDSIRIINPTENQPKLFTTHKVDNDFGVVYYYQLDGKEESIGFSYIKKEETKQEILEEAAEKYAEPYRCPATNENEYCKHDIISAFNNGAKWHAKRSYSEEEVLELLITCKNKFGGSGLEDYTYDDEVKEWFEQFKKK
jgi:hypothetical protein